MSEQRHHKRTKMALKVQLIHPTAGSLEVVARDISDTGVFLLTESNPSLSIGDQVSVRSTALGINADEYGLCLKMSIVRIEQNGVGLILKEVEQPSEP